jgi:hypothetical protein
MARLGDLLGALWTSVARPRQFVAHPLAGALAHRWGWLLIIARWGFYSVTFACWRDYRDAWRPFVAPPFGLDMETYAALQATLAVPFGLGVMACVTGAVVGVARLRGVSLTWRQTFNVSGLAFFLPFVPLQLVDLAVRATFGWQALVIVPLHTGVLAWEAAALVSLVEPARRWTLPERLVLVAAAMAAWIAPCAVVWR